MWDHKIWVWLSCWVVLFFFSFLKFARFNEDAAILSDFAPYNNFHLLPYDLLHSCLTFYTIVQALTHLAFYMIVYFLVQSFSFQPLTWTFTFLCDRLAFYLQTIVYFIHDQLTFIRSFNFIKDHLTKYSFKT